MSDSINKQINITTNASEVNAQFDSVDNTLNTLGNSQTKVTQSTKNLNREMTTSKKTVLENGGAMGILNDATGGLAMVFKDATEAFELAGVSLKGFKGALLATGIGALVVVLLELITNWEKWSGVIDGSTSSLEALNVQMDGLKTAYEDLTYSQQTMLEFMELEGASLDEIATKRRENFDEAQALLLAQLEVEKQRQGEAVKSAAMWSTLTQGLLGDWDKVKAAQKGVEGITRQLGKLADDYYKASKGAEREASEKSIEDSKRNQLELEKQRLALLKQIGADSKIQVDIIKEAAKSSKDLLDSYKSTGPIADEFALIGTTFRQTSNAADELNVQIAKLEKSLANNKKPTKEFIDEYNKQKAVLKETSKEFVNYTNSLEELYLVASQRVGVELEGIRKQGEAEQNIYELKLKILQLDSKLFNFEKSISIYGDNRLDNSNKFLEIETRILEMSKLRKQLIEGTLGLEAAQNKEKALEAGKRLKEAQQEVAVLGQKAEASGTAEDFEAYTAAKGRQLQAASDFNKANLEYETSYNDYKLELALELSDTELAIAQNTLDAKTAIRDEEFERYKMYAEKSIGIAEETATFLDALAAMGGKKGEEFAKAALVIKKAAGVANVVISTQEEVRGIWSNPALTALPDTGIAKKSLLTAGALARSAVSIATILSQKLSATTGGTGGQGGGGGAAAQFNIVESSGTNQLAATIGAQQNQPVNAYVVGTDVSTQQALDRNRITQSTFL